MSTERANPTDRPGFSVRVEFRAGDHDFWGWRRTDRGAVRLGRRYSAAFRGCGIMAMHVVGLTLGQWRAHAEYSRCRSGACPGSRPAPGSRPSTWGDGGSVGRLLPDLAPSGSLRLRREAIR
jgi:hypothetical protein